MFKPDAVGRPFFQFERMVFRTCQILYIDLGPLRALLYLGYGRKTWRLRRCEDEDTRIWEADIGPIELRWLTHWRHARGIPRDEFLRIGYWADLEDDAA